MGGILWKWAYMVVLESAGVCKCCLVKGGLLPCPPKGATSQSSRMLHEDLLSAFHGQLQDNCIQALLENASQYDCKTTM